MKILGIFAHPDDEICFAWPLFQNKDYERHLLTISHNEKNYGNRSVEALKEVCQNGQIHLIEWERMDSGYYRLPVRYADYIFNNAVTVIKKVIDSAVDTVKPDYVFTHNPVGEYGHGDHRLLFEIVCSRCDNVLITDICEYNEVHLSYKTMPEFIKKAYYNNLFSEVEIDREFYLTNKFIYHKHNAWSWHHRVPEGKVAVYNVG